MASLEIICDIILVSILSLYIWMVVSSQVKILIVFCLKCLRRGPACSWLLQCSSFSVLFRQFYPTCGGLPSSPMPLDVWRVATVVTAYIFVAWLGCLADDYKSGGLSGVGVVSLGAALGGNAPEMDGKATQRMCPVLVTRTVIVGFFPWIQLCRR